MVCRIIFGCQTPPRWAIIIFGCQTPCIGVSDTIHRDCRINFECLTPYIDECLEPYIDTIHLRYLTPHLSACQTLGKNTQYNFQQSLVSDTGLNLWSLYSHLFLTEDIFPFHLWTNQSLLEMSTFIGDKAKTWLN